MNLSIKKRIYFSFYILASLFVINGIIIIITLNYNKKLSRHLTEVADPSVQSIYNFSKLLLQSQMYSTNWVFIRSSSDDKEALKKLHMVIYPELKTKLGSLSSKWYSHQMKDSLKNAFREFENLIIIEKEFMNTLRTFEDYDDVVKKFGAEDNIENEVLPRTNKLMNSVGILLSHELKVKAKEEEKLDKASIFMGVLILCLSISIIGMAIFLSLHMKKIILKPIDRIINIVNQLGKGITIKYPDQAIENEIGNMINSVNNLSDNLSASAFFAHEIGNRNFNSEYKPLSDADKLGKALITMRDNLKSSDESLNEAQHIAQMGSWEKDVINKKVIWSDELYRIFDADIASFDKVNNSFINFIHPEEKEYFKNILNMFYSEKKNMDYQCRIITPKGNTKFIHIQGETLVGENGELLKTYGIVQDITKRKQAENEIKQINERFELATRATNDVIWDWDIVKNKIYRSENYYEQFGYTPSSENINDESWIKNIHEEDKERTINSLMQKVEGPEVSVWQSEYRFYRSNGELAYIEDNGHVVRDENGKAIRMVGAMIDITPKKIAQQEILKEQKNLKEAQSIAHLGNWHLSFETNITTWSEELCKIYGLEPTNNKHTFNDWLSYIHPDDLDHVMTSIENENKNSINRDLSHRIILKDGSIKHMASKSKFELDQNNKRIGIYGIAHDITDRKIAELKLEQQNRELKKANSELDRFVYSISHDLRAPLLSMLGVVGITEEMTDDEMTREHMVMLKGSISRLDKLIGEILDYSRNTRNKVEHDVIDFKNMLAEITKDIKIKKNKPVNIQVNISGEGTLHSDKKRIGVILNNLVANAINYSDPKQENPFVKVNVNTDNDKSSIEVEDNGIGIGKEFHKKIFEMFYRGSENSVGSGLGLYIVKETIEKLNGNISMESIPGKGTKFKLDVPNLTYA